MSQIPYTRLLTLALVLRAPLKEFRFCKKKTRVKKLDMAIDSGIVTPIADCSSANLAETIILKLYIKLVNCSRDHPVTCYMHVTNICYECVSNIFSLLSCDVIDG